MCSIKIVCTLLICLLSLSSINGDNDAQIDALQKAIDHLNDADKQQILQSLLANTPRERQDNSHWCCSIDPGVEAIAKTRQTTFYVSRHQRVKCGYSDCGLFGWSSCTRWCDQYWQELQYGVETYTVYQSRLCPAANLVCCAGYITVLNHCFTYDEVMGNKEILETLVSLGIPINPTMG